MRVLSFLDSLVPALHVNVYLYLYVQEGHKAAALVYFDQGRKSFVSFLFKKEVIAPTSIRIQ